MQSAALQLIERLELLELGYEERLDIAWYLHKTVNQQTQPLMLVSNTAVPISES